MPPGERSERLPVRRHRYSCTNRVLVTSPYHRATQVIIIIISMPIVFVIRGQLVMVIVAVISPFIESNTGHGNMSTTRVIVIGVVTLPSESNIGHRFLRPKPIALPQQSRNQQSPSHHHRCHSLKRVPTLGYLSALIPSPKSLHLQICFKFIAASKVHSWF